MNVSKVGNQTSSQDPQAVNSRLFVGNLNTFQIIKTDVEKIFQKYGRIAGISMHKGYAFVQFTSPFDARSACLGEDGKSLCGQILDVNMVSEPKAHQTKIKGQKRQKGVSDVGGGATGSLVEYYMASLTGVTGPAGPLLAAGIGAGGGALVAKRPRILLEEAEEVSKVDIDTPMEEEQSEIDLDSLKTYNTPDILICGNCREMFTAVSEMVAHKRHYCKLRFTCKCENTTARSTATTDEESSVPVWLQCSTCNTGFEDPWDLMEHVQGTHTINIYQQVKQDSNANITGHDNQKPPNGFYITDQS